MKIYAWWPTFASGWQIVPLSVDDDIVINWIWVQNSYYIVSSYNIDEQVDLQNYNTPLTDGRWFTSNYKRWYTVSMTITVIWIDELDFQDKLDNLRKNIFQKQINIDFKINWVTRRIIWDCISSPLSYEHYNITVLPIQVQFKTTSPYFFLLNPQSVTHTNKTSSFNDNVDNEWTAPSLPTFTFVFSSSGTAWVNQIKTKILDNEIIVNETINNNDTLIINWEDKTVKLNNVEKDYDWVFPVLDIWNNVITYTINGTYNVDITMTNPINYV